MEYFSNMCVVILDIIWIDWYIIKLDDYTHINHIKEDVIHKSLESGWSIGESEWYNKLFKWSIAGLECGFPLISIYNAD